MYKILSRISRSRLSQSSTSTVSLSQRQHQHICTTSSTNNNNNNNTQRRRRFYDDERNSLLLLGKNERECNNNNSYNNKSNISYSRRMISTTTSSMKKNDSDDDDEEDAGNDGDDDENSSTTTTTTSEEQQQQLTKKKRTSRLTRKEKGSYAGMLTEVDSYKSHELLNDNLYDTREHVGVEETREKIVLELLKKIEDITSSAEYEENLEREMREREEELKSGAKQILEWETNLVLEAGGTQDHGLNKKVALKVEVGELQEETGLSDDAMEYIKLICGKRFLKKTNQIRIVCRRYRNREHNRQWCLRALYELIGEGQKEHPSEHFKREDILELNKQRHEEYGDSETYVAVN